MAIRGRKDEIHFSDVPVRREIAPKSYWPSGGIAPDVRLRNQEYVNLLGHFEEAQVVGLLAEEGELLAEWFHGGPLPEEFDLSDDPDDFLRAGIAEPGTCPLRTRCSQ